MCEGLFVIFQCSVSFCHVRASEQVCVCACICVRAFVSEPRSMY